MYFNGIEDVMDFALKDLFEIIKRLEESIKTKDQSELFRYMDAITYLVTIEDHIKLIKSEIFITRKIKTEYEYGKVK